MAKILVVESSNFQRKVIVGILESSGHKVVQAMNGKDGLNTVKAEKPEFILVDVAMPEMDGLSMIKALKSTDDKTPFAILTSDLQPETQEGFEALGMAEFINKPVRKDELLTKLKPHLG